MSQTHGPPSLGGIVCQLETSNRGTKVKSQKGNGTGLQHIMLVPVDEYHLGISRQSKNIINIHNNILIVSGPIGLHVRAQPGIGIGRTWFEHHISERVGQRLPPGRTSGLKTIESSNDDRRSKFKLGSKLRSTNVISLLAIRCLQIGIGPISSKQVKVIQGSDEESNARIFENFASPKSWLGPR